MKQLSVSYRRNRSFGSIEAAAQTSRRLLAVFAVTALWGWVAAGSADAKAAPMMILAPSSQAPVTGLDHPVDVPVTLTISPKGELRCVPAMPKTHPELRRPSCLLIVGRGTFGPSTDKNGQIVETVIDFIVRWLPGQPDPQMNGALPVAMDRWITPADYPVPEIFYGITTVAFRVTDAGRIESCHVVKSSKDLIFDDLTCRLLQQRAILLPPLDDKSIRTASSARFSYPWPYGDATFTSSRGEAVKP